MKRFRRLLSLLIVFILMFSALHSGENTMAQEESNSDPEVVKNVSNEPEQEILDEPPLEEEEVFYTVTFDTLGGNTLEPLVVKESDPLKELPEPVKEGFIFKGWSTNLEEDVVFDPTVALSSSLILYALWEMEEPVIKILRSEELVVTQLAPIDPANVTSVRVTKSWVGVVPGNNPEAIIELYDVDNPMTVIMSTTLTPSNNTIIWEGLPYVKGDPPVMINYQIREIVPTGYEASAIVKTPATISNMVRTTPNNNLEWPITQPSFVVTKPTGGEPYIIWTLNHMPVSERATFIENFHEGAATYGANLGPFGSLSLSDEIIWIEGPDVYYDIYPSDPEKGLIEIEVLFNLAGQITSADIEFQSTSSWTQFIVGTYSAVEFTLTNIYRSLPGLGTIAGTKQLSGRELFDGEFTFELYLSNAAGDVAVDAIPIDTTTNVGNDWNFDLSFDTVGTFYYVVRETHDSLGGITYDSSNFLFKVEVEESGVGPKNVMMTAPKDVEFNNDYLAMPGEGVVLGSKELSGRPLLEGEFTFELYAADELGVVADDALPLLVTSNTLAGDWRFLLEFADGEEGTYYYVVRELDESLGGVDYDTDEFLFMVNVWDDLDGQIIVDVSAPDDVEFNNEYMAMPGEAVIAGMKNLIGRELLAGEFTFELYDTDERGIVAEDALPLDVTTNTLSGAWSFDLMFDSEGTYYYVVRERVGLLGGVTYDSDEFLFMIEVTDNLEGMMEVVVTPSEDVEFNNLYEVMDIIVTKLWIGGPADRPDVEIQLFRDGVMYRDPVVLEDGKATHTFEDLYVSDGLGHTYIYTVEEVDVPENYVSEVNEFVITNTYVSPLIDVTMTKVWENITEDYPEIEIQLFRNGEVYLEPVTLINGATSYTWMDLDEFDSKGIPYEYSVDEVTVPTGFAKINTNDLTITNVFIQLPDTGGPKLPDTGSVNNSIYIMIGMGSLALGMILVISRRKKEE